MKFPYITPFELISVRFSGGAKEYVYAAPMDMGIKVGDRVVTKVIKADKSVSYSIPTVTAVVNHDEVGDPHSPDESLHHPLLARCEDWIVQKVDDTIWAQMHAECEKV